MKIAVPILSLPPHAPWRNLSWGLFLPLVFASNVFVSTFAWTVVGLAMK
jgi:hypothetical protein